MGLFDRFRSTGPAVSNGAGKPDTSGQDATCLIDEGHVLEAEGKLDEAMQRYLEAIRLAPNPARAHLNHGNILLLKGDLNGALDAFRTAIRHRPDYAGAYYNIGNALLNDGKLDEAAASYHKALDIQPDYAEVHCSLGVALKELGQFDGAIARFRKALQINPDLVEARLNLDVAVGDIFNRGNFLMGNGQLDEAVENYRRVLEIEPNYAEAYTTLGVALEDLGQLEGAVASYRRALKIKPDSAETHCNLGAALIGLGQLDGAVASCRRALELKPNFPEAHSNLGNALIDLGQLDGAVASYRRALEFKPNFAEAHSNLGLVLANLGQLEGAMESYRRALEIKPDHVEARGGLLFALNYTASRLPSANLEDARQYGRIVTGKAGARTSVWQCVPRPERLRVGLVSGDFYQHSVGHFLEGLLSHIDPARIELIAYPTNYREDELTARIRPYFSKWKPLTGSSDEASARLIRADAVHVLIDLSGHTGHNRLPVFARKPAPVQVSWLGYFASTGVAEMDYLLADKVGVPEAQQAQFTESVWYLPETRLCFTAPKIDLPVAALPALKNGYITFGCFQNLAKAGDGVLETWGKILAALPNAKLRVQSMQLGEPAQVGRLLQRLRQYGIASARVVTHGPSNREAYLAAHAEVDMILDTFPYPGGTTTCDALWMGVPTLTLAGDSLLARQGASLLTVAGLEEWVTTGEEEYVAKAIALASDKFRLANLRAVLRQQVLASPLFDAPRFAKNFEDALWGMWQRYQTQQEHPA